MTLKYYNSYLPIAPSSPKQIYWDDLQAVIDDQFENASDYLTIQKESSTSPNSYEDIGVRLTVPYQLSQRFTIKDDCREILFKSNDIEIALGDRYQFNGFYWLTVDTGRVETPTNSCQIERCNASLKFYDENGDYNEIPCIAQSKSVYDVKQDKMIWIPDGKMRVLIKYDKQGKKINIDRRFIINGLAWRCGSRDYITYVRNNQGYIEMYFASDFESSNDKNGVADVLIRKATYNLSILNEPIPQITPLQVKTTDNLQLNIQVDKTINSISTSINPLPNITYVSDNPTIVQVSNSGLITFLDVGVANITALLSNDSTVFDTIQVEGISVVSDNYTIELVGDKQPDTEIKMSTIAYTTYTATLYNNGNIISDAMFDFVLDQGVTPISAFSYIILNDYQVKIQCKQYVYNLILTAKWRNDNNITQTKNIKLRGLI
jgi:hypothetical protein